MGPSNISFLSFRGDFPRNHDYGRKGSGLGGNFPIFFHDRLGLTQGSPSETGLLEHAAIQSW